MAKILAVIPARSGSKGLQHKNVRMLGGRPVLEWAVKVCKKSSLIDEVMVSTESQNYAQLALSCGASVPFLRPPHLASDQSKDIEVITHLISWLEENGKCPNIIVHIRPTTPLRDHQVIDNAIDAFLNATDATALRSVHIMSESAYKTLEVTKEGLLKRIGSNSTDLDEANNARQEYPHTYVANGYVDVLSVDFIKKTGLLHGSKVIPFFTGVVDEIDNEDDFDRIEHQISMKQTLVERVFCE